SVSQDTTPDRATNPWKAFVQSTHFGSATTSAGVLVFRRNTAVTKSIATALPSSEVAMRSRRDLSAIEPAPIRAKLSQDRRDGQAFSLDPAAGGWCRCASLPCR